MLFAVEGFAKQGKVNKGGGQQGFFATIGSAIRRAARDTADAAKLAVKTTGQAVVTAAQGVYDVGKTIVQQTGKAIKNAAIKTKNAAKVGGAKFNNAIKDSYVHVKWKLTGRKPRVWVVGHFTKDGIWRRGHWRRLSPKEAEDMKKEGSGVINHPGQGAGAGQVSGPGQSADAGQVNVPGQSADAGQVNVPGQSADAGQSSRPQDPFQGQPEYQPEDPFLPDIPEDFDVAGDPWATTPTEEPQPEAPADFEDANFGEQGEAADLFSAPDLAQKEVDLRTLGMLMNDLIEDTRSMQSFRSTAVANPQMSFSMQLEDDLTELYDAREENAALLTRVIVWDLQQNNGNPGVYYRFFDYIMNDVDDETRELIRDVTDNIRAGVRHGAGHVSCDDHQRVFQMRLSEMEAY